jgi:hypothetical protein
VSTEKLAKLGTMGARFHSALLPEQAPAAGYDMVVDATVFQPRSDGERWHLNLMGLAGCLIARDSAQKARQRVIHAGETADEQTATKR